MIRRAGLNDAPGISALEQAAAHAPWSERAVAAMLDQDTTEAWIECLGEPVAYLLTSRVLDEAEVLTVGTSPTHRRQGHARALLEHAAAWWVSVGVCRAHLEVREDNTAALALYHRLGWTPAGRRRRYYRDGCDALCLTWER